MGHIVFMGLNALNAPLWHLKPGKEGIKLVLKSENILSHPRFHLHFSYRSRKKDP